jgi:hypothetical protein
VSIQGTSALNTVFSLAEPAEPGAGPAFEFGVRDSSNLPINGQGTFIDRISIYGATVRTQTVPQTFAAIYIAEQEPSRPTITNCFIFRNGIGIAICATRDGVTPAVRHDGTTIVNNTFAFNECGVWNGQMPYAFTPPQTPHVFGVSRPILINNLFDTKDPSFDSANGWRTSAAQPVAEFCPYPLTWHGSILGQNIGMGFVGISRSDMTVASIGPGSQPPSPWAGNYNAYEYNPDPNAPQHAFYNFQNYFPPGAGYRNTHLPAPWLDPLPPSGSRNVARLSGQWGPSPAPGQARGVLYIRDLFCSLWKIGGHNPAPGRFDLSAMDFRLSPTVAESWNGTGIKPGDVKEVNPLINSGFAILDLAAYPIVMENGLQLDHPPGYLPLESASQATWPFHAWLYDCEGYGNPRVYAHPARIEVEPPDEPYGYIDIGADEVADLIHAGYQYGTTTFASFWPTEDPDDPGTHWPVPLPNKEAPDNRYLYLLGPVTGPPLLLTTKPDHARLRTQFHRQLPEPPPPTGTYPWTFVLPGPEVRYPFWDKYDFQFLYASCAGSFAFYHPAWTHIVPHLLPDIHPWWEDWVGVPSTPSNIRWLPCDPARNFFVYWNPLRSTANPAGAYLGGGYNDGTNSWTFDWLDVHGWELNIPPRVVSWKAWGGGPASIHGFDEWCRAFQNGNPNPYDTLPGTYPTPQNSQLRTLRFTLENSDGGIWANSGFSKSNLQSFQIVVQRPQGS